MLILNEAEKHRKIALKKGLKKSLKFLKKGVDRGEVMWYYNQAPEKRGYKKDLEN